MTYRFTQTESAGTVGLRSREAGVARQPRKRTYDLNLVRLRRLSDGAQTDCSRSPQPHAAAGLGRWTQPPRVASRTAAATAAGETPLVRKLLAPAAQAASSRS